MEKSRLSPFPKLMGTCWRHGFFCLRELPCPERKKSLKKPSKLLKKLTKNSNPFSRKRQPLVENINVQYNKNIDANETGTHVATVSVDLLKAEKRNAKLDTVKNMWREKLQDLPDIINLTFKEPTIGPGGFPIEIRLQGNDLEQLKQASLELQDWLNQYVGVFDLNDDLRPGKPEIRVRLKAGALAQGMDCLLHRQPIASRFLWPNGG